MTDERAAFQSRVQPWMLECFGAEIAADRAERNHRFLEEALELVQACGCTASEAHQLVDYTFGRPVGEPAQEVGGVMVTLAALCLANDLDMHAAGETELARVWTKVEQIRAKQAAKPKHSPLPVATPPAIRAALTTHVEKIAPVQGYSAGIPWSLHLEAYDEYRKRWGRQDALIDLEGRNCRGGFGTDELDNFIPGWRERASEIGQLRARVAELEARLSAHTEPVAALTVENAPVATKAPSIKEKP